MSTKSSLAYERGLHIYFELIDEKYYIEDEGFNRIQIPKDVAIKFSQALIKRSGKRK